MVDYFGGIAALLGAFLALFVILVIAGYIYMALVLMTVGKKLNFKYPWLAWIPVANVAMVLAMGGFHWAWIFLSLVPVAGAIAVFVMSIVATWKIFEKRKYPGALALVVLAAFIPFIGWLASIANLVIWGLVAWKDR